MKEVWFNYVVENKKQWVKGFSKKRLEKIRDIILNDEHIMFDLLSRHGAKNKSPEEMKRSDLYMFTHAIGNLEAAIFDKMVETGIYKIK
jgi:hypothetical protein